MRNNNPILNRQSLDEKLPGINEETANKLGVIDRYRVNREISKTAKNKLIDVEKTRLEAQAEVAVTAIRIAGQQMKQAILADNVEKSGVLMANLNLAMSGVNKTLTTVQATSMYLHEKSYQDSCSTFKALDLSPEQFGEIDAVLQHNKYQDQRRDQEMMEASKDSLSELHLFVLRNVDILRK